MTKPASEGGWTVSVSHDALREMFEVPARVMAWALIERALLVLLIGIIVSTVITTSFAYFSAYDSTDDAANGVRSNLIIRTDYGTGVQYLVTGNGGITPRLTADGDLMIEGVGQ